MDNDSGIARIDVADLNQPARRIRTNDHREPVFIFQPCIDSVAERVKSVISRDTVPECTSDNDNSTHCSISCGRCIELPGECPQRDDTDSVGAGVGVLGGGDDDQVLMVVW